MEKEHTGLTFRFTGWSDKWDTDCYTAFLVADNVPEEIVQQAKDIDGDSYCKSCFNVEVIFEEGEFHIGSGATDNGNFSELFYVDEDGGWCFMDYELSESEELAAIELAKLIISELY